MFEKNPIQPVLEDGEECLSIKTDEEIEAENYVLNKILVRPSITIFTILKYLFIFLCTSLGLAILIFSILKNKLFEITDFIVNQIDENSTKVFLFVFIIAAILVFILLFKNFLVGLIHLYQKYAPEEKRRSCLFKPTCSEYAILALNKYGVIRGIPKILNRFKRCHGNKYRIDYP